MAAITSTQTGNWESTGTWVGGVVPGDGDTVTIATTHTVTVATGATVGNTATATGTDELTILGNLTIASGATLTVQGDTLLDPTASGDGILTLVGTGKFSVNGNYRFRFDGTDALHAKLATSGTAAGTRAFFGGATGTDTIYFDSLAGNTFSDIIEFDVRYCDFDYVNDGTNFINNGQPSATSASNWYFQNCKFNNCGRIRYGAGANPGVDNSFEIVNCDFRNPIHQDFVDYASNDSFTTGVRRIDGCTCVGTSTPNRIYVGAEIPDGSTQFLVQNNILEDTRIYNLGGGPFKAYNNVHRFVNYTGGLEDIASDSYPGGVDLNTNIIVATRTNAHIFNGMSGTAPITANTVRNNITFGSGSADNHYAFNNAMTISNNISIGGNGVVTTATSGGTVVVDRHTHINKAANFDNALLFEHGAANYPGDVTYRNSLQIGINSAGEEVIDSTSTLGAQTMAYVGYNCNYNCNSTYVNLSITTDATANDITDNPQLNNENATLATWDTLLSGAGTVANAFAEMLKRNGHNRTGGSASFNSAYTQAALLAYLQNAFTPTNAALQGTGLAGVDIGAMAVVVPTTGSQKKGLKMGFSFGLGA